MKSKNWFARLSPMARQEYLSRHPKSKMRGKSVTKKSTTLTRPGVRKVKVKRPAVTNDEDEGDGIF